MQANTANKNIHAYAKNKAVYKITKKNMSYPCTISMTLESIN